jgi:hypothetical protein
VQVCTLNGHLYRVIYVRCRIDTINSSDEGHMAARNMYRIEINIHEKEFCVRLVIYKDYTDMHGQQSVKNREQSLQILTGHTLPSTSNRLLP